MDGAIHRAAGPSVMAELRRIREREGPCPAGSAVITGAGLLGARWILHAVGPVWRGGDKGEPELLGQAYGTCLDLANGLGAGSIAFPSISTGAYGYPVDAAARVALAALAPRGDDAHGSVREVRMVLFTHADLRAYRSAADALGIVARE